MFRALLAHYQGVYICLKQPSNPSIISVCRIVANSCVYEYLDGYVHSNLSSLES